MVVDKNTIIPVILSGGSGTRLWPLSRKQYPKQFIDLAGKGKTMLQMSALRTLELGEPVIVCSEEHRFIVGEQLQSVGIKPRAIILEPVGRNTAAAIATAAHFIQEPDKNAIMAVFPADHLIHDELTFLTSIKAAIEPCRLGKLVTFGVQPDKPETGYGYIQLSDEQFGAARAVQQFVEKPDLEKAREYIADGQYLWNSGMFMFRAATFLEELDISDPDIVTHTKEALTHAAQDLDFLRLEKAAFSKCKNISVDYAVMESSNNVVSIALDVGWSDIGSWESLWQESGKDVDHNVLIGDVISHHSNECFVHSKEKLTALVGVSELIVVDTDDSLLIIDKNHAQDVKHVVAELENKQRNERLHHRHVHRPWGSFDSIKAGERYQVKQLSVKPGASLSLQLHHHRAEHWIVVEGTAEVVVGENVHILTENESIYIPVGVKHQLTNPGKLPLKVIEVQSGAYLAEDDIVRFDDPYNRD